MNMVTDARIADNAGQQIRAHVSLVPVKNQVAGKLSGLCESMAILCTLNTVYPRSEMFSEAKPEQAEGKRRSA